MYSLDYNINHLKKYIIYCNIVFIVNPYKELRIICVGIMVYLELDPLARECSHPHVMQLVVAI